MLNTRHIVVHSFVSPKLFKLVYRSTYLRGEFAIYATYVANNDLKR
jgi:hypothetical protein